MSFILNLMGDVSDPEVGLSLLRRASRSEDPADAAAYFDHAYGEARRYMNLGLRGRANPRLGSGAEHVTFLELSGAALAARGDLAKSVLGVEILVKNSSRAAGGGVSVDVRERVLARRRGERC